jgi:hypothetical protein
LARELPDTEKTWNGRQHTGACADISTAAVRMNTPPSHTAKGNKKLDDMPLCVHTKSKRPLFGNT